MNAKQVELRLGVVSTTTGNSEYYGAALRDGVLLAVSEFNATSPDLRITTVVRDDGGDDRVLQDILNEFDGRSVVAILGPSDSQCCAEAARLARARKIPLLSPGATAGYLTDKPNPWFFRCVGSDNVLLSDLCNWLVASYQGKPILIVHEQRDSGAVIEGRPPYCGEEGGQKLQKWITERAVLTTPIVDIGFIRDTLGESDRVRIQQKVRESKTAALVILGRSCDEVLIADWARRIDPDLPIYVISPAKHLYTKNRNLDGILAVTDSLLEAVNSPRLAAFREQYRVFRPQVPEAQLYHFSACFGYDAARIAIGAIERMALTGIDAETRHVRDQFRKQLLLTPRDRIGLVSDGGFTDRNELYIRPHRQELQNSVWGEVTRKKRSMRKVTRLAQSGVAQLVEFIKTVEHHPLFVAMVILTTLAAAISVVAAVLGFFHPHPDVHTLPGAPPPAIR
jgi:hypothetical protein